MKTKAKKLTPREASTVKQICDLPRQVMETRDFWIMVHENHVVLSKQRTGHPSEWMVEISKAQWNRLVDFYNGVTPKPRV